jgi:predicted nucleotidyltransferase
VYTALEELADKVIFIGGATVSLYAQRPVTEIRPTDDIDILVELLGYKDYASLEEKLRVKGFENDMESGMICRYKLRGIVVDIMPVSDKILGFANRWYPAAAANATQITLDETLTINIFQPVYLLATKLEAFKSRGKNDGRLSSDFEDIIFLLNNRSSIWEEMSATTGELNAYLVLECRQLLVNPYLDEWISVHLDYAEQKRVRYIVGSMNEFVESNA